MKKKNDNNWLEEIIDRYQMNDTNDIVSFKKIPAEVFLELSMSDEKEFEGVNSDDGLVGMEKARFLFQRFTKKTYEFWNFVFKLEGLPEFDKDSGYINDEIVEKKDVKRLNNLREEVKQLRISYIKHMEKWEFWKP